MHLITSSIYLLFSTTAIFVILCFFAKRLVKIKYYNSNEIYRKLFPKCIKRGVKVSDDIDNFKDDLKKLSGVGVHFEKRHQFFK